jgi:hypothetical protein
MVARIVLLNLETFCLITKDPGDQHIPSDERQVCISTTQTSVFPIHLKIQRTLTIYPQPSIHSHYSSNAYPKPLEPA